MAEWLEFLPDEKISLVENKDIRALTPMAYHLWPQMVKADAGFNLHSQQHCQCVPGQVRPLSVEVEFQLRPDVFQHSRGTQNKPTLISTVISGQSITSGRGEKHKRKNRRHKTTRLAPSSPSAAASDPSAAVQANGVKFVKLSCAWRGSDSH
ncbi:hypothetical protein ROHU_025974 [Labeo rohita]|uniref:Uncharacterized protein n=1 Tax=Labeo rohita TaxID=84645 RepID=A0A498MHL0_LABRO|nr:hypothetical protein ROHU_032092 [Labeo rohita]RXN18834.1 hypothetical protein ROHU_025974 [Labeo rohita]